MGHANQRSTTLHPFGSVSRWFYVNAGVGCRVGVGSTPIIRISAHARAYREKGRTLHRPYTLHL